MIQLGTLRTFTQQDGSESKPFFKAVNGLHYDSLKQCFDNLEEDLPKFLGKNEHFNLFYTVGHHLKGQRTKSSWQGQDIIPFDLDGIDLDRIDEYPPLVAEVCQFDLSSTAIIYSGNGCHILVQVPLIKVEEGRDFVKESKLGYKQLLTRIKEACDKKGLPFDIDTTALDYARILRCPFTLNKKQKKQEDGSVVEVVKECRLVQNNLAVQDWKIPQVEKVKESLSLKAGSFPTPDSKEVLKECRFFDWLKNSPDEVHEPHAYAMLSIAGHFNDERKTAKELYGAFSSPSINAKPFDEFIEQALTTSGPRTCKGIEDVWGKCATCPHYNKITSPILLKSEDHIGTEHMGFTTFSISGKTKVRHYDDLLKFFDRTYKHKSVGAINKVYLWHDTHYRITDDVFIRNFADKAFIPYPKSDEKREFLAKVKDSNYTDQSFLDNDKSKGIVNLSNGMLDLETNTLLPHDPSKEFLYCLPFDYDPSATCPRWDQFIEDVTLGRECLKNIIHEYLGYIISGSNYKYQKALILDGSGNNGKTTFLKVMKKLVGNTNISNLSLGSLQSQVFASAGLHGKLCNISEEEPEKTFREQNGVFKNLTGDGVVNAQHKFGNPFEFENKAKIVITYNEMPYVNDTTKGMLRRLLITPWEYDVSKYPEKKDPDIEYKLYQELSGIFNRCLEGWYRLEEQKGFTKSIYVERKVKQVHSFSDVVFRFLEECTENVDITQHTTINSLYEAYTNFHLSEGENSKAITKNSFQRRLRKEGYDIERKKINGKNVFIAHGVKLFDEKPF